MRQLNCSKQRGKFWRAERKRDCERDIDIANITSHSFGLQGSERHKYPWILFLFLFLVQRNVIGSHDLSNMDL